MVSGMHYYANNFIFSLGMGLSLRFLINVCFRNLAQRANEMTRREKTTPYIPRGHELHEEIPSGELDWTVQNGRSLFIDLAVYTKERNIRR